MVLLYVLQTLFYRLRKKVSESLVISYSLCNLHHLYLGNVRCAFNVFRLSRWDLGRHSGYVKKTGKATDCCFRYRYQ